MNKNTSIKYFYIIFLITISFSFIIYNGYRGVYPIDSFIVFNGGYNVLNGYHPFKDYWSITGPILDYLQAFFFSIFGINWKGYLAHSLFINIFLSLSSFFLFSRLGLGYFFSFLYSACIAILAYPQTGTPFMDHHAFYFAYIAIVFLQAAIIDNKKIYWFLIPVFLLISFLSKQLPAGYILIFVLCFFIYYLFFNSEKKYNMFFGLLTGSVIGISIVIATLYFFKIQINDIVLQYLKYPLSIGEDRIQSSIFNLKSIFFEYKFIYFSTIIIFFYFFKITLEKINKKRQDFDIILINIFLLLSLIASQILTKNQILIFFLIPHFLAISHYLIKKNNNKKIFQNLILLMLIFTTLKYHDRFNYHKKFMELENANFDISVDAKSFDKRLKGLKWITPKYIINPDIELKMLIDSRKIINENSINSVNSIIITDYQIFQPFLNFKTVSPLKWYDNMSIPSAKNPNFQFYKNYVYDNLKRQKIKKVFLLDKTNWMIEDIFDDKSCLIFKELNQILVEVNIEDCFKS